MSETDRQRVQRPEASRRVQVISFRDGRRREGPDLVAVEEPLEIRVVVEESGRRVRHPVAVTMRTPGQDAELAAGFLCSEGLIEKRRQIWKIAHCLADGEAEGDNVIEAFLAPEVEFDVSRFSRNVYTSSSCGICGKASLELVRAVCPAPPSRGLRIGEGVLRSLPERLRSGQEVFGRTGGLHAAGLFDTGGRLRELREDVGRHNALDKLIGSLLLAGQLPASESVLLVSGRASFELVQKALIAGIPLLAAVGAPSSLAVELAVELGMTLVGFLGESRFNLYSGSERVVGGEAGEPQR